jgi:branched-chain amino acid transport system substrate-binding protein
MRRTRTLAPLTALVAVALLAGGCGDKGGTASAGGATGTAGQRPDHLTIYLSLAFDGASKPSAESIRNSAQLALEQSGARAGGLPVVLVALDDALASTGKSDRASIEQNARTAADDPTTIAYIGDQASADTAVSLPITNAAGILQVSPTNTSPGLTQTGGLDRLEPGRHYPTGERTFGRIVPTDTVQAAAQLALAKELGCQQVGLVDDEGTFGRGLAHELVAASGSAGVTLGPRVEADLERTDGSAAVSKVVAGTPDCVIFAGSAGDKLIRLWRQLHAALPTARLIGPNGLATAEFALRIGAAGRSTYLTTPTVASKYLDQAGRDYLASYAERFGATPDRSGIYGYETMRAVLAAIDAAGKAPARSAVVARWFAIRDRASALGPFSITSTGDSTLTTYGAFRVVDEALVFDRVLDASPVVAG